MQRICFVLQVKPDRIQEYKDRHRSVWPEMKQALQATGWNNYSLFLRADGLLMRYPVEKLVSAPEPPFSPNEHAI